MEKVAFRLVAALKVMDAMTKKSVTDARIVSCQGFRRINKENGIIVLVDDSVSQDTEVKEIFVDSPYYQPVEIKIEEKDIGALRRVWLVPGPRKGLPETAAVILGHTAPDTMVSCEFRDNESGLRLTEPVSDNEIYLATIGCKEPEGSQFLISDGKVNEKIFILDKLGEEDGFCTYKYYSEAPITKLDRKKTKLYPVVTVQSREDGEYYLPVWQDFSDDGWSAALVFSKDGKVSERKITIRPRMRLEEDCLKL